MTEPKYKITYIEGAAPPPSNRGPRHAFYKIELSLDDGKTLPITIATRDINRLQPLVESQIMFYAARGLNVTGFKVADIKYTVNMSEADYQTELTYCDNVDENSGTV